MTLSDLYKLQPAQAHARLSNIVLPPREAGMICSTLKGCGIYRLMQRQYSQRPPALASIARLCVAVGRSRGLPSPSLRDVDNRTYLQLCYQLIGRNLAQPRQFDHRLQPFHSHSLKLQDQVL